MSGKINTESVKVFAEPLSKEASYWLGFLLADGCVYGTCLGCKLKASDEGHLQKLASFLKVSNKIQHGFGTGYGHFPWVSLSVKSKLLVERLRILGITPRKSLTAKPVLGLNYDRDFWRGVVDGDGSFGRRGDGRIWISLRGTEEVVKGFVQFCNSVTGKNIKSYYVEETTSQTIFSGTKAEEVLNFMYYESCLGLDRKVALTKNLLKKGE
jgi:hypothetical protein